MDFKSMLLSNSNTLNEAEVVQIKNNSYVDFINHKRDKAMLYSLGAHVGKKFVKIIEINAERIESGDVKIIFNGILAPKDFITLREEDLHGVKSDLNQPYKDLAEGLEKFMTQINYLAKW